MDEIKLLDVIQPIGEAATAQALRLIDREFHLSATSSSGVESC